MNRQSIITILFTVLMNMNGANAFAYVFSVDNSDGVTIYYKWANNEKTELAVSYHGYNYSSLNNEYYYDNVYIGDVVIPKSVAYKGNTYNVTSIGDHAFHGCRALTSVTIPNSVTSISDRAFYGCNSLTSIIIPNSVTSIGEYAFSGCGRLITIVSEVKTPFEIGYIGDNSVTLIVPTGTKAAYQNTAGWSNFTKTVEVGEGGFAGCKFETDGIYYTIDENNTASLTSTNKSISGAFAIPSQVELNGKKYNVTSIGSSAFSGYSNLTSVTIPNSVTSIGNFAFNECSGLTSVTIPNCVTSIGESAFYGCRGLTSVTIPNSVTSIGKYAFKECDGLTSVIIGSGISLIGLDAFSNTNLKKTVWLTNTPPSGYSNASGAVNYVSNDQFTSLSNTVKYQFLSSYFEVDGIRYVPISTSERTCDAIDCVYNESGSDIKITSTVVYKGVTMNVKNIMPYLACNNEYIKTLTIDNDGEIANNAFYCCSNMKSISIGQKVSSIGSYAFQGCSSLKSIEIPNLVTLLSEYVLSDCSSLTEIKMGSHVDAISQYAFSGCSALPSITIPKAVTTISNYVFNGCTNLKKVIIADSDVELKLGANHIGGGYYYYTGTPMFSDCPLDSVYIGRNIDYNTTKQYGYSPFYGNTSLRSVKITDLETEISDNEFYGCTNLQRVVIGDGVTTIGNWAFSGCSSLKYFTFGSKLENIGQEAFSDCTDLVQITSKAKSAPACGSQALEDINKWECKLYVPKGCMAVYQAADQWKDFFFMEEGESTPPQEPIIGDVNCDGKVNNDDLNDLVSYIMGNKPNGVTKESANVNGDNKVDIADVVALVSLIK